MAERTARPFDDAPAEREQSPLLIGLAGASGSGKTFSALRLATGIVSVTGGEIYFIDTDNRRALHYADRFKFRHVGFNPPFSSLAYVDAIRHCVKKGAGAIIIDSMSHEHEGEGGMLSYQEAELDRMAGDDFRKRESMKMLAWAKPKAARRALIIEIQRLGIPTIFCFRAKEGVKPIKVNGKTEVVQQGFSPIAGDEFVFEMTLNTLLLPGSKGVPTWTSEQPGEHRMIKLPVQFESLESVRAPLDEKLGENLAKWAKGGAPRPKANEQTQENRQEQRGEDQGDQRPTDQEKPPQEQESGGDGDFPGDRDMTRAASKEDVKRAAREKVDRELEEDASRRAQDYAPSWESERNDQAQEEQDVDQTDQGGAFGRFADLLAGAEDWPSIEKLLGELTQAVEYKAADHDRQMMARKLAYVRLRELNERGYRLDFITNAQAFRCYVEAEDDDEALALNFMAFKETPVWKKLADVAGARHKFVEAVDRRIADVRTSKATEGTFA